MIRKGFTEEAMFKLNLDGLIVFQADKMGIVLQIAEILWLKETIEGMNLVSSIFLYTAPSLVSDIL